MPDTTSTHLKITHRGTDYPVALDHIGRFTTEVAGHDLTADTFRELIGKVERVPRVKVDVPFVHMNSRGYGYVQKRQPHRAASTGIHADGDKALVREQGSTRPAQFSKSSLESVLPDLPEEEFGELERLCQAEEDARLAVDSFIKTHEFDAWKATRDAVDSALKEAKFTDE